MHAIILAGGLGTRLKDAVPDLPKPMAPIAGRPFVAWLIDALLRDGVTGITFSVHHQWEKIRDYFDKHKLPVPVNYVVEKELLGTGGAIAFALKQSGVREPVIIVNGDTFVKVDYRKLYEEHIKQRAPLTIVLRHVPDTGRYGEIMVQGGAITSFALGKEGQAGLINAGIYVVDPDLFTPYAMPQVFSFERDFLPMHVQTIQTRSYLADDYFIDIGIPEDYARACKELTTVG